MMALMESIVLPSCIHLNLLYFFYTISESITLRQQNNILDVYELLNPIVIEVFG